MAATRNFKKTIMERVHCDLAFANGLLEEASTLLLNGEPETARLILRDLVNATIGFEALAEEIATPPKSLHRMLSERGNPSMNNVAAIFGAISKSLNVKIQTNIVRSQQKKKVYA